MRWRLANTRESSECTPARDARRRRWFDAAEHSAADPLLMPEGPFCERYYRRRSENKDSRELTLLAQSARLLALASTLCRMPSKRLIITAAVSALAGT